MTNLKVNSRGSLEVALQDQFTNPVDFYFTQAVATTTLSIASVVDANTITVTSATGAVVGQALNIYDKKRFTQAIVTNIASNVITFNVPMDRVYLKGSTVEFANWNMNLDGSSVAKTFSMKCPTETSWDITRVIFSISDDAAMDDGKFGGITALSKGVVLRKTDGEKKNIFVVSDNGGFTERAFDVFYSSKAPAGTYGFVAQKEFAGSDNYGVTVRLDGSKGDKLDIIIQDNITGVLKFVAVCQGHVVD